MFQWPGELQLIVINRIFPEPFLALSLQKILCGKTSSIFPPKPLGLPYLLNKQKSSQGLNLSGFQGAGALHSNNQKNGIALNVTATSYAKRILWLYLGGDSLLLGQSALIANKKKSKTGLNI
jgi:hypothetical protein